MKITSTIVPATFGQFFRRLKHIISSLPLPDLRGTSRFKGVRKQLADLKTLCRLHDPRKAARSDALKNQGNPETARGHYEHSLAISFENELDKLKRQVQSCMGEIQARISGQSQMPRPDEDEILFRVKAQENRIFEKWRNRLIESRLGALRNKRALNVFRRENEIVREVRLPSIALTLLSVAATCAIESFFNFQYLAITGIDTPTNTLMFVAATGFFNVALGNLTGYLGVRSLSHRSISRKLFGMIFVLLGVAVALGFHFLLANYRHAIDTALALSGDPAAANYSDVLAQHFAEVKTHLLTDIISQPWGCLGDISALVVLGIGMILNMLSIWEGAALWNDPYPGLGECEHAYRQSSRASTKTQSQFRAALDGILSEAQTALDALVAEGAKRLNAVKRCLDDAIYLGRQYEEEATKLENTLVRMVADYRDEYLEVREAEGPQYWEDDVPRLDRDTCFVLDNFVEIQEKESNDFHALVDMVETTTTRLIKEQAEILARLDRFLQEIDTDISNEDKGTPESAPE